MHSILLNVLAILQHARFSFLEEMKVRGRDRLPLRFLFFLHLSSPASPASLPPSQSSNSFPRYNKTWQPRARKR